MRKAGESAVFFVTFALRKSARMRARVLPGSPEGLQGPGEYPPILTLYG